MINRITRHHLPLLLLSAALIGFTSCSSPPATGAPTTRAHPTPNNNPFGGEVVTDAATVTATVVSVTPAQRRIVLNCADGTAVTHTATPAARGLNEIKVGDRITLAVAEELAVFMGTNGVPPEAGPDVAARLRARLPANPQAILTEIATLTFTGQIAALNDWSDTVTLQFGPGLTKTIRVGEYVNLAEMQVGDRLSARCTQAAALTLQARE